MAKPPANSIPKGKPPAGALMVNLVESRLPEAALVNRNSGPRARDRLFALEVDPPAIELKFRRGDLPPADPDEPDERIPIRGRCPRCSTFRPAIAIVLTADGWMCDGCVTDLRRHGQFREWD